MLDFFVVLISFILFLSTRGTSGGMSFPSTGDYLRAAMTFPILRLFTQVDSTLLLVYTIIVILPQFTNLFILLILVFYVFGIYGILLFKDKFKILHDQAPGGTFDSLRSAFVSEFQLFVGQSWGAYLCKLFPSEISNSSLYLR